MLDERIRRDLEQRLQAMGDAGELRSRAQLDAAYSAFRSRSGPEVLASLDGEALLNAMHYHGNRDSLVYWLEFKDDDEFPNCFGSIAGGSALKFGLYRRRGTGAWMTGSAASQRELTVEEAVQIARRHREQLLRGAELATARAPVPRSSSAEVVLRAVEPGDSPKLPALRVKGHGRALVTEEVAPSVSGRGTM